ncbi:MAG: iron export ABC transporter permease subunit FetB [Acidimicrobiia bacterium]
MNGPIDLVGVAASLALIVVAIALSAWRKLGLGATITWAAAQAAIQLFAVGFILVPVLAVDAPLGLSFVWVAAMVAIAAETVQRRAPRVRGLRVVALGALGLSLATGLLVVFGLSILPLEPVAIVPVAGILVGNTMPSTVLAVSRTVEELESRKGEIEAMLALGFSSAEARRRPLRLAARTALIPQIERTKIVGLVALPGAMTGLLLAGVDPVDAVAVQLAVMYLILGAVAVSVLVVVVAVAARAFTPDGRFVPFLPVSVPKADQITDSR